MIAEFGIYAKPPINGGESFILLAGIIFLFLYRFA